MNNKIKIVFVIDTIAKGGAEKVVNTLSHELTKHGFDVTIFVVSGKENTEYEFDKSVSLKYADTVQLSEYGKIKHTIIQVIHYLWKKWNKYIWNGKKSWANTPFFYYDKYTLPLSEIICKNKRIVCIAFLFSSQITVGLLPKRSNVIKIFCERAIPIRPNMSIISSKLRNNCYKRYDTAVFQTEEQKKYYSRIREMGIIIENPINGNLPLRIINESDKRIVNFCRLAEQKNIPLLLKAFKQFYMEYSDYRLEIYGDGKEEYIAYIKNMIIQMDLEQAVKIKPFEIDIHQSIRSAQMFVSTSDFEGLSNSMLEAMAMGLPCVCTDCDGGGARMMIRDHENGLLVPKGDAEAVYRAMKEIIEDPALAEKLSRNARKVREELAVDRIVDKWIEVIGE